MDSLLLPLWQCSFPLLNGFFTPPSLAVFFPTSEWILYDSISGSVLSLFAMDSFLLPLWQCSFPLLNGFFTPPSLAVFFPTSEWILYSSLSGSVLSHF